MLRWRFRIRLGRSRKKAASPASPPPPAVEAVPAEAPAAPEWEPPPVEPAPEPIPLRDIRLPTAPPPEMEEPQEADEPAPPAAIAQSPSAEENPAAPEWEPPPVGPALEPIPLREIRRPTAPPPGVDDSEAEDPEDLDESAPLPPPPPLVGVTCPNCSQALASRPMGQSPCPHCGRIIHVRARQGIYRSGLVGEKDVDAVDFLESVERFGVSEAACRQRLQQREGQDLAEVLWDVCESRVMELPEAGRARLLEEMAMFRKYRGEEYDSLRRRAAASQLHRLRSEGVGRVRIGARGGECCPACAGLAGTELAVADALEQAPLPAPQCARPDGLCRCAYLPA